MASQARREPRRLGANGPHVFPIALGCMGMSGMYGPSDEKEHRMRMLDSEK
jgi:aryl-alcohol dehydrogenase-like predicted oxidoreductase